MRSSSNHGEGTPPGMRSASGGCGVEWSSGVEWWGEVGWVNETIQVSDGCRQ